MSDLAERIEITTGIVNRTGRLQGYEADDALVIIEELWDDGQRMAAEIAVGLKVNTEQAVRIEELEDLIDGMKTRIKYETDGTSGFFKRGDVEPI